MWFASWLAPLVSRANGTPTLSAATAACWIISGSMWSGSSRTMGATSTAMSRPRAISARPASNAASVWAIAAGWIPRKSARSSTPPGTTFTMFGCTVSAPTVPTMPRPASRARRSTRRTISAAGTSASFRTAMGVPPA